MFDPMFFGYGSLVNRSTHGYPEPRRATLTGWRRVWRHTPVREAAFLTAIPSGSGEIDGLVARVPKSDWAALDLREANYDRVQSDDVSIEGTFWHDIAVYTIPETTPETIPASRSGPQGEGPGPTHSILLSYLDVVVQGFLREYGRDGVRRFFLTTQGWDAPVRDDRARPIYARAQILSGEERALVDAHLADVGAHLLTD